MKALVAGLAALLAVACGGSAPQGSGPVRVQLNWFPEHEHGGYFAALVSNGYRDAGLDVQLLPGGPNSPVLARVATGEVEFGVVNADDVVLSRAAGAPVVALMAPFQHSPVCVMVHASSGITKLDQLRDMTLAMQIASAHWRVLQKSLPLPGVTVVPYSGSIAEFLVNEKYGQQAYSISEPILAADKGADPRCLMESELGFDPYTSILVAREQLLKEQPELVAAMVRASAAGWAQYVADPGPANARILQENPVIGAETLAKGAKAVVPLVRDPADPQPIGTMVPERWTQLVAIMTRVGLVEKPVEPAACFDPTFLAAAPAAH